VYLLVLGLGHGVDNLLLLGSALRNLLVFLTGLRGRGGSSLGDLRLRGNRGGLLLVNLGDGSR
jgi:hypothetical protein